MGPADSSWTHHALAKRPGSGGGVAPAFQSTCTCLPSSQVFSGGIFQPAGELWKAPTAEGDLAHGNLAGSLARALVAFSKQRARRRGG